ncbi:MAG: hypothetical protein CMJ64_13845 [Planctomycetaceae bacterium]|nr:hypothetical protein [Planctomycetaceae bacterium]
MSSADITSTTSRGSLTGRIRNRIFEGLLVILPIAITWWIVAWLYNTLRGLFLNHVIAWVVEHYAWQDSPFFERFLAPAIAMVIVLCGLWVLGIFFHSRVHRILDWILLHVPVVTTIYAAVRKVVAAIGPKQESPKFKRVVLVPFPHPGMKVPAFVTASCKDVETGKTILCVYVPTTPIPTSGYMLMLPEEDVIELSWSLDDTLQAIVSGGITVPERVEFFPTKLS